MLLLTLTQRLLSSLYTILDAITLKSKVNKIVLEVVVLLLQLENLLLQKLCLLHELLLFVLEELLMRVVIDIRGEELLDLLLFL